MNKTNNKVVSLPYTPKMLADELDFEENTVKLALQALEQLNMIVTDSSFFKISGWEEYQNIEGMDKIRQQNRIRKQRQREKAALIEGSHVMSRDSHATDIDKERDKEKEPISKDIGNKKPVKHKYGEYANVLLTDEELEKLKNEYIDWEERIERLSSYVASTGKAYKSHYATIRNWARKDVSQQKTSVTVQYRGKQTKADELESFYNMAREWSESE